MSDASMNGTLRRIAVVAWAMFGCIGTGVLCGYLWLDRELAGVRRSDSVIQFVTVTGSDQRDCPAPPRSMDEYSRQVRARVHGDLRTYVGDILRCTRDDRARTTFIAMLRAATAEGNTLAARAFEVIVRGNCETLLATAGAAPARTAATVGSCVDLAMRAATRQDMAAAERLHVFRLAQLHTLVDADASSPEIVQEFCAAVHALSGSVVERIITVHPAFGTTVVQECADSERADDTDIAE